MHAVCILICALAIQATMVRPGVPIRFEKDGKWGYTDDAGKVIIPLQYRMAGEFSEDGIAAVVDDEGWLYIDRTGRALIRPFVFDNGPDYFVEDVSRFVANRKIGFCDRRGKPVIPARFDFAMPFSEGRAAVCKGCNQRRTGEHTVVKGGQWGFITQAGELIVPYQFEAVEPYRQGRAKVQKGGAWVYIDFEGRTIPDR